MYLGTLVIRYIGTDCGEYMSQQTISDRRAAIGQQDLKGPYN